MLDTGMPSFSTNIDKCWHIYNRLIFICNNSLIIYFAQYNFICYWLILVSFSVYRICSVLSVCYFYLCVHVFYYLFKGT